ncbi:MAG: carboxypeptidase-like regulatory domain-containing protein [Candidatus Acidiferrum sp.]
MKSPRWIVLVGMAAMCSGIILSSSFAQEPPPPPPPPSASSAPAPTPANPKQQEYSHADDFLIIGTVFSPKGYAFPGVQLKIRRSTEKKFRWNDYTNSRGEFAVRVPQGSDYQLVMHVKGFEDQTRDLDAKSGIGEARLVFRMEPGGGKK